MKGFRLKPKIWIDALRRRAETSGAFVMVIKSGDPDGGSIAVQTLSQDEKVSLYTAQTQIDGSRAWAEQANLTPEEVAKRLSSLKKMDEDIWIVEVMDGQGRHFINEPILMM
ncbi:MAG: DUF1491 family protein [Maricaulaceae bacterium]